MHNNWICREVVDNICEFYKNELNTHEIEAANESFIIYSNYSIIDNAVLDFYESQSRKIEKSKIYIINTDEKIIKILYDHCKNEKVKEDDFFAFQCEKGTWLLTSEVLNIGITFCINTENDQWESPLLEQLRWHIATHVIHRLESKNQFCFHSSAVKRIIR